MYKKVDVFLTIVSITLLSLAVIGELGNLLGFGTQEVYLHHPDFPEGENFIKDIENGKLELLLWAILTMALLVITIYSKVKRDRKLFNWTALTTFIVTSYLPFLTIANGMIARGFLMLAVLISLIAIVLFQIRREKALAITSAIGHGG